MAALPRLFDLCTLLVALDLFSLFLTGEFELDCVNLNGFALKPGSVSSPSQPQNQKTLPKFTLCSMLLCYLETIPKCWAKFMQVHYL